MAGYGILDVVYTKEATLLHLDDGTYLQHDLYMWTIDDLASPTNTPWDDTLDVKTMKDGVPYSGARTFYDSTGQGFTMQPAQDDHMVITRDDGSTAIVQMGGLAYLYGPNYPTYGDGLHIDINSYFKYPSVSKGVFVIDDSSGAGFEVTQGSNEYISVKRDNGEVIFFQNPSTETLTDAMNADGTTTNPYDGRIDIAGIDANMGNANTVKMVDPTDPGFVATPGPYGTMIITRSNGDQYMIDSTQLGVYSAPSIAGTGDFRVIDLDKLLTTQLNVAARNVYKFEDSSGQDFTVSIGAHNEAIITRADGTVIIFDPRPPSGNSLNVFDTYTTSGTTGGVDDGIVDVAALFANQNLNVGGGTNIMSFYDSTGMSFTVTPGYHYMTITREDGKVYLIRTATQYRDEFDEWSVAGGFTGGANDGRIDVAAIAKWQTIGNDNTWQYSADAVVAPPVCFVNGTMIATAKGMVAVECLKVGDKVRTKGNGMQVIRWIGSKKLSAYDLHKSEKLSPVRIMAGALGNGLPRTDLLVSRQHRMYVRSDIAKRMFGETEVLVAAIALTKLPGIYVDFSVPSVEYFHIAFDNHEIVFAEGAPSESLYLGPDALQTLTKDAVEEIYTLFPHIKESIVPLDSARFIPDLKQQKKLIERLSKNGKYLLC